MKSRPLLALTLLLLSALAPAQESVVPSPPVVTRETLFPALKANHHFYILAQPLKMDVKLSTASRAAHYAFHGGCFIVKNALVFNHLGVAGLVGSSAEQIPGIPRVIFGELPGFSYSHLLSQERHAIDDKLMELADVPGILRAEVLSAGETEFKGALAVRRDSKGLVMIETTEELAPDALPAKWGKLIEIHSASDVHLTLSLEVNGRPSSVKWKPDLLDASTGARIPVAIANHWRADVDDAVRGSEESVVADMMEAHREAFRREGQQLDLIFGTKSAESSLPQIGDRTGKAVGTLKTYVRHPPQDIVRMNLDASVGGLPISLGTVQYLSGVEGMLNMTKTSQMMGAIARAIGEDPDLTREPTQLGLTERYQEMPTTLPPTGGILTLDLSGPPHEHLARESKLRVIRKDEWNRCFRLKLKDFYRDVVHSFDPRTTGSP